MESLIVGRLLWWNKTRADWVLFSRRVSDLLIYGRVTGKRTSTITIHTYGKELIESTPAERMWVSPSEPPRFAPA